MHHVELGRIAGIPIYIDMFFVLVMLIFGADYFTSGDTQIMSAGLIVVAGVVLSILLHELGHAFAARMFKIGTSQIELSGLGGLAQFDRSLPNSVIIQTIVFLAGPAVNLVLSYGFGALAGGAAGADKAVLAHTMGELSAINMLLFVFNMLPAFPLDGGRTLDALFTRFIGNVWSVRIVSGLGFVIATWLAYTALPANFFRLFLAFFLFQTNWLALQGVGGWKR
jgi:Zn-dependent protease